MTVKYVSLIPATNEWRAVFHEMDGPTNTWQASRPLIGWALTERGDVAPLVVCSPLGSQDTTESETVVDARTVPNFQQLLPNPEAA